LSRINAQRLAEWARRDVAQRQPGRATATIAQNWLHMKLRGELEAEDLAARDAAAQSLVAAGEALQEMMTL